MSVSGPSPLGTLLVQRVEAALGTTLAQQANIATGARPDAVTQPGQPDKADPIQNPPPKEQGGARHPNEQGGRQAGLAALARNDPEIAKLLAARNAPMTAYTASAPTTLGQAAKTILALLQQFPDARPAVPGRAPLLGQAPGQGGPAGSGLATPGATGQGAATSIGGNLDPRAIEALMQRAAGGGQSSTAAAQAGAPARPAAAAATHPFASGPGAAPAAGPNAGPLSGLPVPGGMAGQLALALAHALQGSGLFYESHLRAFAFGQRSLPQMRAEPQAQAGQGAPPGHPAEATQARGGTDAGAQAGAQPASHASATPAAPSTPSNAHLAGALLGLDPSTHALVRQQLETLSNQAFAWQGEAWPGTDLEWEVRRRESQDQADAPDSWATRLRLELPGLGEVRARLSLSGSQLILHLVAPAGANLMADHTDLLRQRLGLQGLQLSQLTIAREDGDHEASST